MQRKPKPEHPTEQDMADKAEREAAYAAENDTSERAHKITMGQKEKNDG